MNLVEKNLLLNQKLTLVDIHDNRTNVIRHSYESAHTLYDLIIYPDGSEKFIKNCVEILPLKGVVYEFIKKHISA